MEDSPAVTRSLRRVYDSLEGDYYFKGMKKSLIQRTWHRWKLANVVEMLEPASEVCVDIGCDAGLLCDYISRMGRTVIGLDISISFIRHAKHRFPHMNFVRGDAHNLPFRHETFNAAICSETLEHLQNPETAIREASRVLRERGIYVLLNEDDHNPLWKIVWYFWQRKDRVVWEGLHISEITMEILKRLLSTNSLRIEKTKRSHMRMVFTVKSRKMQ